MRFRIYCCTINMFLCVCVLVLFTNIFFIHLFSSPLSHARRISYLCVSLYSPTSISDFSSTQRALTCCPLIVITIYFLSSAWLSTELPRIRLFLFLSNRITSHVHVHILVFAFLIVVFSSSNTKHLNPLVVVVSLITALQKKNSHSPFNFDTHSSHGIPVTSRSTADSTVG